LKARGSSLSEKKLRGNYNFRIVKNNWLLKGYGSGAVYTQTNNNARAGTDFLSIQKRSLAHEKAGLCLTHYWRGSHFDLEADAFNYSGKNYFGKIFSGNEFIPAFKSDNANEVFNLRQNRKLYGGRIHFALSSGNYHSLLDVLSNFKHYEDSTRNGLQNYSASQDIAYTVAQHLWKVRYMNIIGGFSVLQDKATEKLNGSVISRNLVVPGIYTVYEFSKSVAYKLTAQSSLDFHPLLGKVFQPSLRMDFNPVRSVNLGFFYNRGQRMVNVLQENAGLIAGNRTVFIPLNVMQESYHKSGFAADFNSNNRMIRAKFVYHFDFFNKYVFADPGGAGNELKFTQLQNSFKRHVFESSFYLTVKNGTYLNLKMRNNIFNLSTEKGKTELYYTPKNDFILQGMINFYNRAGKHGYAKNSIDLQISQYLAGNQKVFVKDGDVYKWQNKKFYQLDLDLVLRSEGKSKYDEKKQRSVIYRSLDLRISWINVTSFMQKDVFVQATSSADFSGMQTWANYNPSRVCVTFLYKFGKIIIPGKN
jgi:hypothetical protein